MRDLELVQSFNLSRSSCTNHETLKTINYLTLQQPARSLFQRLPADLCPIKLPSSSTLPVILILFYCFLKQKLTKSTYHQYPLTAPFLAPLACPELNLPPFTSGGGGEEGKGKGRANLLRRDHGEVFLEGRRSRSVGETRHVPALWASPSPLRGG
jgi:hypothetical protein